MNSEIEIKNEWSLNTSIILESSEQMPKWCAVRINAWPQVYGLVVTVHSLSMSRAHNDSCDNNIEFDSLPIIQWCDSSDAKTLIFEKNSLDIAFNSGSNNSLYFKLVVTPYESKLNSNSIIKFI